MASSSLGHDPLPRRNARSLDLDDSAAKAAAWVWHLHTSKPGNTTDGRFISSQNRRRRSSSNYDRKATRFQQEASVVVPAMRAASGRGRTMWDCGSNLYDTFELVSFGNRLDRSLMEDVFSRTPQLACRPQEHHMKSPLHEASGILRTHSLPRGLSQRASEGDTEQATPSPSPGKFKLSESDNKGSRKAKSLTGSAQIKASTRWNRVRNFMNVIKKVVVLHKQADLVGCKRSINIVESSQRPLDSTRVNEKVSANLSPSNLKEGECTSDDFPTPPPKVSSNYGSIGGSYKLSIPRKDKSMYERNRGNPARAYSSSESYGSGLSTPASTNSKSRSRSESMRDALLSELKKSRLRKKYAEGGSVLVDERIKGGILGVNEKERVMKGANYEKGDHYKHLHHHHHHHHHHHYLFHNLASESARLSPETMSRICADQSWLI